MSVLAVQSPTKMPRGYGVGRKGKHTYTSDELEGLFPSEFATLFLNIPNAGVLAPFSFEGCRYLLDIYDTPAQHVLLLCARQVAKSTTLGNRILAYLALRQYFRALYVSPTELQTSTFSRDRLAAPIKMSEKLRLLKGRVPQFEDNVMYKRFTTQSDVTLRYAFLHADRVRGIPADLLCVDELQDIVIDVLPVIEEVLSRSSYKLQLYSGTPKSLDNTIAAYWERFSTRNEWAIPCECCNHWNIPGEDNIGLHHLICAKCGRQIYPMHPKARWVSMRTEEWLKNPPIARPYEGYRIPQIIVSWMKWDDILLKRTKYTQAQFNNEVLGQPFDNADRLLTKTKLLPNCTERSLLDATKFIGRTSYYMGIDWGTGESGESFTVACIGGYLGDKFHYIWFKRYEGADADPEVTIADIVRVARQFGVSIIGADYGGGYDRNDKLIKEFSLQRVARYQYCNARLLSYDKTLGRFMANKTELVMSFVNAIVGGSTIRLPRWEDVQQPFMEDCMAVFKEWNKSGQTMVVSRVPGSPDDTLHAMLYCFLASMIHKPRPDIITPTGPEDGR